MAKETTQDEPSNGRAGGEEAAPAFHVAPAPHISDRELTTRRMMIDVLIGLAPIVAMSLYVFRWYALIQLGICVASCLAAELVFTAVRRRPVSVGDFSAVVTGAILALSLPGTAPWYVGVLGGITAIGLGKFVFGGLGQNIFNPAMVGRAFVMITFTSALAAPAFVDERSAVEAITGATPLTALEKEGVVADLRELFIGTTNGSLGETSAIACILGGLYLCIRRTASWRIPLAVVLAAGVIAGVINIANPQAEWTALHHLLAGALLFGAFFIATDPVSSPLTHKGQFIFGLGIGALVMLMRTLSSYPEGVMFAVLIMNSVVPLINRWTIPRPLGGPVPAPQA
ncbi:MAG: RnfABCDGE type electron transport complex subunit D [Planctomycetota bacterium]|jgi:electron transport complex protein RnfD